MIARTVRFCWSARTFSWLRERTTLREPISLMACTVTADLRDDPRYWRFHAKEILGVAECLEHEKSKMIMRRIADDYEYIAKLIERQERQREKK